MFDVTNALIMKCKLSEENALYPNNGKSDWDLLLTNLTREVSAWLERNTNRIQWVPYEGQNTEVTYMLWHQVQRGGCRYITPTMITRQFRRAAELQANEMNLAGYNRSQLSEHDLPRSSQVSDLRRTEIYLQTLLSMSRRTWIFIGIFRRQETLRRQKQIKNKMTLGDLAQRYLNGKSRQDCLTPTPVNRTEHDHKVANESQQASRQLNSDLEYWDDLRGADWIDLVRFEAKELQDATNRLLKLRKILTPKEFDGAIEFYLRTLGIPDDKSHVHGTEQDLVSWLDACEPDFTFATDDNRSVLSWLLDFEPVDDSPVVPVPLQTFDEVYLGERAIAGRMRKPRLDDLRCRMEENLDRGLEKIIFEGLVNGDELYSYRERVLEETEENLDWMRLERTKRGGRVNKIIDAWTVYLAEHIAGTANDDWLFKSDLLRMGDLNYSKPGPIPPRFHEKGIHANIAEAAKSDDIPTDEAFELLVAAVVADATNQLSKVFQNTAY